MGKYKVLKKLGQGSYGTVFLVQDSKDGRLFVMKKITVSGMNAGELSDCKREIQILSMLQHPNIIGYQRSFVRRGALCIVMDYADNGDLHRMIHRQRKLAKTLPPSSPQAWFPEEQVLDWFTQVALGLRHMHRHKILHRDLKTQNIFLTKAGEVRLGDFGISRVMRNTMDQARTLVGTPYYLSPEMVNGQPYDNKTDMWSLGVVLYEMLTLQHPFNADSLQMLALRIIQGNYPPIPAHYSQELNALLALLLEQNAAKRLSIDALLDHPMISRRADKFMALHANSTGKDIAPRDENVYFGGDLGDKHPKPFVSQNPQQIPSPMHVIQPAVRRPQALAVQPVEVQPKRPNLGYAPFSSPAPPAPAPHRFMGHMPMQPTHISPQPVISEPLPDSPSTHSRGSSLHVNEDMMEEEPDWEVRPPTRDHRVASAPQSPQHQYRSDSVQSCAYQVNILRQHLQQRLGDQVLQQLLACLSSDLDDASKAAQVEQLIRSRHEILPIVHTMIYLEQRL